MFNLEFYGMFDYVSGDNDTYEYTSAEFASLIQGLTGNGVSKNAYNEFEITNSGLTLTVKSGAAYIEGHWCYDSHTTTINLDAVATSSKRYDRIVLSLDITNRAIGFEVLKGTATTGTPTKPALVNSATKKQIPLYSCLVVNGSTITLEDERVFTYSASAVQAAIADLISGKANTSHTHTGSSLSTPVPISRGGTGASTATAALSALGAARSGHTHDGSVLTGTVPVAKGGTGATSAAQALTNLGAAATVHTHLPTNCGFIYSETQPEDVAVGSVWLKPSV